MNRPPDYPLPLDVVLHLPYKCDGKGVPLGLTLHGAWQRFRGRKSSQIARKIRSGQRAGRTVELTRAEMRVMFERMVRRELNISTDEFLDRLDRGDLPDTPAAEHLALLAGGARTRL